MLGIKNHSTSFTIIKKSDKDHTDVLSLLDDINLTKHKYTGRDIGFDKISGQIQDCGLSEMIKKTFVHERNELLIIKEFNFNFFYSKRYLEKLVEKYPNSLIGMIYIQWEGSDSVTGGELRLINKTKPIVWIRSLNTDKRLTDFDSNYFDKTAISKTAIDNKEVIKASIEQIIKKEFDIEDMGVLVFKEVSKLNLLELNKINYFTNKELKAIDESYEKLSEVEIYSGYGWGKNVPQIIRDEQMPSIKELSQQVMRLVSKTINDDNYKYLKSKKSLSKKTKEWENIITLSANGYGTKCKFNLLGIHRNNELAESINEFKFSNKLNSGNDYKKYWTITTSSQRILLGEMIATTINSLISQTISTVRLFNESILDTLDNFAKVDYIDKYVNSKKQLTEINYFTNNYPFSRITDSNLNEIGIAIMNQNPRTSELIESAKGHLSNEELVLKFINKLRKRYGT
jgi:hypothetical protein